MPVKRVSQVDMALLVVMTAVVYGRLAGYDFLNWDDNQYVLDNETIRGFSLSHLRQAFAFSSIGQYNPVQLLSYMADYTFWGLHPAGYHLTNIILHTANGLLVYRLLFGWYGERLLALVAALFFLFHPLQVESVAWISERKDLLAMFFFLVSWEAYRHYREGGPGQGRRAYAVSLCAFALSLLSKPVTVIMPLVLLLYDRCFPVEGRPLRFGDKLPYLALSVMATALGMYAEMPELSGSRVAYHGGSPLATLYTMLPVFCRNLLLLLWPSGLSVEYQPDIYRSVNATVIGAALLLAGVAALGARLYRADRRLGFWVMFFWVGFLPVSQIVPIYSLMYDHYFYLPILGVAALAGSGAVWLRDGIAARHTKILYGALALWLLALTLVSFQRVPVWSDSLSLFSDATRHVPNSFRAWWMLGEASRSAGKTEQAISALKRSLELYPTSTDVLWSLGDLSSETGRLGEGRDYLNRLLAVNPAYVRGWASLGNNYRHRGDYEQAARMYARALELQPDALEVIVLQVKLAAVQGDADRALGLLEKALSRGYRDFGVLSGDKELAPVWSDPRSMPLMQKYFPDQMRMGR